MWTLFQCKCTKRSQKKKKGCWSFSLPHRYVDLPHSFFFLILLSLSGSVHWFFTLESQEQLTSIFLMQYQIDCSQSPIFSWDRLGIPRLTVTGILIFKCTEGAGVGNYSSGERVGGGREKLRVPLFFSLPPKPPPPPSSFDTHARWQPVTQSARSRWCYGKIEDC